MKIEYIGPKEIISAHGINFKSGKDDKYVYIYPAMQIYDAIHHDYEKDVIYTHNIEGKRLNNEELLNKIFSLKSGLEEKCRNEISELEIFLNEEIEKANKHKEYNNDEQKIYINNLKIMKEYQIQRGTNKVVYRKLVELIVNDIFKHRIKEISAPFNERYWHLLQTIQGELSNHNGSSIGSKLDLIHNDKITIKLRINSIGK